MVTPNNMMPKHGVLLINLGTPTHPGIGAVGRYLIEFLSDKRVITLPAWARFMLLYGLILPFRIKQATHAYRSIWSTNGSPLLQHSEALAQCLQERLGAPYQVALGMRYGKPRLQDALQELSACSTITVLPLYPQYASSSTGSALEVVLNGLAKQTTIPRLHIIHDFYAHPRFIDAEAILIKPHLAHHDYVLFSYHGLPEHHVHQEGCQPICKGPCLSSSTTRPTCYRAQCFETSRLLATRLALSPDQYGTVFQSRLGKSPWIKPYIHETLPILYQRGIRRLAIACPSFVADCLETLEEIGIKLKQQWCDLGGGHFTLIPSLNTTDPWIEALMKIIHEPF